MSQTQKFFDNKNLNNYFVRSESVKGGSRGLVGYVQYLEDMEHKNHKDRTSEIIHIHGNKDSFINTVVNEATQLQLKRDKAGKGGRPVTSFAQSFVFAMPSDFVGKPTKQQYKNMTIDMLKIIAKKLNLNINNIKSHLKINVHVNNKNPHVNIVIGRIINGINHEQILTRPSTSNALKRESVRTVLKHLNLDIRDYKPLIPKGTTTGPRWDEMRKEKEYKFEKYLDFSKKIQKVNKILIRLIDLTSNFVNDNSEDLQKYERDLKIITTSINKSHKSTVLDIKNEITEIDYSIGLKIINDTKNNIEKYNNLKKTGRKIRALKMNI